MKIESYEKLRARLMRDPDVRGMIQKRAYEIYLQRGNQSGGAAHDWLQAESEILSHLVDQEKRLATGAGSGAASSRQSGISGDPRTWASTGQQAPKKPRNQTASKKARAKDEDPAKDSQKSANKRPGSKKADQSGARKKKKSDRE